MFKFQLFSVLILLLCSCSSDQEGFGNYYEKSYSDFMQTAIEADSIHLIVEQLKFCSNITENIATIIIDDASIGDTLKLELSVNFGSYSPEPDPIKYIDVNNDTVTLWYAATERSGLIRLNFMAKSKSIAQVNLSPKPEYYCFKEIIITLSGKKKITTESIFYQ